MLLYQHQMANDPSETNNNVFSTGNVQQNGQRVNNGNGFQPHSYMIPNKQAVFQPSQNQPQVAGMPQLFPVGRMTSFDLLLNEEDLQDSNLLNLPFFNSLRSMRSQVNGNGILETNPVIPNHPLQQTHHMKEENDLALTFEDSNEINPAPSQRSVDFLTMDLRNLANQDQNQRDIGEQSLEDVDMEDGPHKRKGTDAGFFSSRRSYGFGSLGESLRSQGKSIIQTLRKPFSLKKKSKTNESYEETQEKVSDDGGLNFEGGKHYSRMENIVLVGEIYTQLFINPALKKQTWTVIAANFEEFFSAIPDHQPTCVRTSGALERHFKVLKEQNRKEGGTMFVELYEEYKSLRKH